MSNHTTLTNFYTTTSCAISALNLLADASSTISSFKKGSSRESMRRIKHLALKALSSSAVIAAGSIISKSIQSEDASVVIGTSVLVCSVFLSFKSLNRIAHSPLSSHQ